MNDSFMNPMKYPGSYEEKNRELKDFLEKWKDLPKQRDPLWRESRKSTIGGSQVAGVMGLNDYVTLPDVVGEKIGIPEYQFRGSNATRWGSSMESVIVKFTSKKFNCKIYEAGSIPGMVDESGEIIQAYSPDGLAVVKSADLYRVMPETISVAKAAGKYKWESFTILFEFKCPHSKDASSIPKYYLPQPQLGMCTIKFVDFTIFGNSMMRLAPLENFTWDTKFTYEHHRSSLGRKLITPVPGPPIGLIICGAARPRDPSEIASIVYDPSWETDFREYEPTVAEAADYLTEVISAIGEGERVERGALYIIRLLKSRGKVVKLGTVIQYLKRRLKISAAIEGIIDFGKNFHELQTYLKNEDIKIWDNIDPIWEGTKTKPSEYIGAFYSSFVCWCITNNFHPVGFIPVKIFELNYTILTKDPRFEDRAREAINRALTDIKYIRNYPQHQQLSIWLKMYPSATSCLKKAKKRCEDEEASSNKSERKSNIHSGVSDMLSLSEDQEVIMLSQISEEISGGKIEDKKPELKKIVKTHFHVEDML